MSVKRNSARLAAAFSMRTPEELLHSLRIAWQADTSAFPERWSPQNPSFGQCAVTALIVQDLFGGELLRGTLTEGSHYWNRLPDGQEVDLTLDQFEGSVSIIETETRTREYVLSYSATQKRYHRLITNLESHKAGQPSLRISRGRSAIAPTMPAIQVGPI